MIHPQACVDPDVQIGEGSRVWQFASVIRGAVLGEGCSIASCAIVDGAKLGDGCIVAHGASVHPGCRAGHGVFFGPGSVVCNDRWPRADKLGFDVRLLLDGFTSVIIENGASIGANAVILPGVVIGRKAMIAAGSVVTADIPPSSLWTRDGLVKPHAATMAHTRMRAAAE